MDAILPKNLRHEKSLEILVGGPRVEPPPPPLEEILDLYWKEVYPIPILN